MKRQIAYTLMVLVAGATLSWACSSAPSETAEERTGWDAIEDGSITMRIKTAFLFSGHLNPFHINVDTRDGVVTLYGVVPSDIHRDLAGEIAKNAKRVKLVRTELQIAPDAAEESAAEEHASGGAPGKGPSAPVQ